MNYLQLELETREKEVREILVALLSDAGFESFEENEHALLAFIKQTDYNPEVLEQILKTVPVKHTLSVVPPQNWNAQWESSFEPIIIKEFACIRASFHQPVLGVQHEIIITPKMSFGTGHHATTYMMIEQMEALDFSGKSVMDYGTGTAVLAILAEKMGAVDIDAVDYDEWSIENSIENTMANDCTRINLIKDDTIATGKVYDIILANINLNVILQQLLAINAAAAPGTHILLSGFMGEDEQVMVTALREQAIQPLKTLQKSGWISILAVRS